MAFLLMQNLESFSEKTGVNNFKFTADMATAWRKVKRENDTTSTFMDKLKSFQTDGVI